MKRRPKRPRFSTLVAGALGVVAVLLAATAVLLNYSSEPRGKTVVTVRIWADQIGSAYRESFDAFTRAHPDIEVRRNLISRCLEF